MNLSLDERRGTAEVSLTSDPPGPLSVLLTNFQLGNRAGTELVIRDLALALKRAGHRPMVYSPILGDVAAEIAAAGISVVDRIDAVPEVPDVIHGQHHVETVEAMLRFPETPAIYVCHDRTAAVDVPPQMPGIMMYVVPDQNCRERVALLLQIPLERIRLVPNWVDAERFRERDALPATARRALIFSNYAVPGGYMEVVARACRAKDIHLDTVGLGIGQHNPSPEELLPKYDIVFAKARCALEAVAVGCAVVLCDRAGLGPMVKSGDLEWLRAWNFGMRLLIDPVTPETVSSRIAAYDPEDARLVSQRLRTEATLDRALATYLTLYRGAIVSTKSMKRLPAPIRLRRYIEASTAATAHLEHQVETDKLPVLMRRLTAAERRDISLRVDRSPGPLRTGLRSSVAVIIGNKADIALHSAPPFPIYLVAQWEAADMRRAGTGPAWDLHLPAKALANSETRFQFEMQPPRSGRLRLRLKLVQPDPLAAEQPTVIAETTTTLVALPANLLASIMRLCRRAGGLAAAWNMFI